MIATHINTARAAPVSPEGSDARLVRKLTCFDALTGLPNRVLFREQLDLVLRMSRRNGAAGAVLLADIDDFRRIRNSLGHANGDTLIKTIASRLGACLRDSDVVAGGSLSGGLPGVARLSGNEFAIVLSSLRAPHEAQAVAQRLRDAARRLVRIADAELFPTLSIGVCLFPDDGDDADALLQKADIALGQAKEGGKDCIHFYSEAIQKHAAAQLALQSDLRQAVDGRQFFAVYQPRIDTRSGQVCGLEALLRWAHPRRGVVAPGDFLAAAEQSQLIVPMGEFMLEAACRQNRSWQALGLPAVPVGVNVSAAQVARPDFVNSVARAIERSGLAPEWLELEITESLLVNDAAGALRTFSAIKAMGVRIAIDDFGTGFSSLAYLRDFPFDMLKIDRSFVNGVPDQPRSCSLTLAIIDLSQRLGLEVVAEGVETSAQSDFLAASGCPMIQGFLHARPMPPEALERFWREGVRTRRVPAFAVQAA